jgi:hypothetical protein
VLVERKEPSTLSYEKGYYEKSNGVEGDRVNEEESREQRAERIQRTESREQRAESR